jgi:hypothetical protein
VESAIRTAFADVTLGDGISLRQARAIEESSFRISEPVERLRQWEVTDDWPAVPEDELSQGVLAHLDGAGLRYYLPAFMIWLLDRYDETNIAVIGTIGALAPDKTFRASFEAIYRDVFSAPQRAAIGAYVEALPGLINLDRDDAVSLERAFERYWSHQR